MSDCCFFSGCQKEGEWEGFSFKYTHNLHWNGIFDWHGQILGSTEM